MRKFGIAAAAIAALAAIMAAAPAAEARGPGVCVANETDTAMQVRMDAQGRTGIWRQLPARTVHGPCFSTEVNGTLHVETGAGASVCTHRTLFAWEYRLTVRETDGSYSCG